MKTIGMIGGLSWAATAIYYQLINREVQRRLGGIHSAKMLICSLDFAEFEAKLRAADWDAMEDLLATAGVALAKGHADFVLLCCNTGHMSSEGIERASDIPFLHIADPVGAKIKADGLRRVGLVGTSATMEKDGILIGRLRDKFGLDVIVPAEEKSRAEAHRIIVTELALGQFLDPSRAVYRELFAGLEARGAQGIILGCTELPMLLTAEDSTVPQFDPTALHAMAAVDWALA